MKPRIIFHLNPDGLLNWRQATRFELYSSLAQYFAGIGLEVSQVPSTQSAGKIPTHLQDGNLHFAHGGNVQGTGWLNTSMAYLPGFWHINSVGILANSPARHAIYDPETIKTRSADRFFEVLKTQFLEPRRSRYWQPKERAEIPKGAIAVFLQGRYPYANRQSYMTIEEMLEEVFSSPNDSPIVVKPHPLERDFGLSALQRVNVPNGRIVVTHANVHDILDSAKVVVSVNSSVSFEGFMHAKPSILFGRADFSQLAKTVFKEGDFVAAYDSAISERWDYKKMLYWYFKRHTVSVRSRKLLRVLAREILIAGLNPEDFGLSYEPTEDLET